MNGCGQPGISDEAGEARSPVRWARTMEGYAFIHRWRPKSSPPSSRWNELRNEDPSLPPAPELAHARAHQLGINTIMHQVSHVIYRIAQLRQ